MKELLRFLAIVLSVPASLILLGVLGFCAGWFLLCAVFGCP